MPAARAKPDFKGVRPSDVFAHHIDGTARTLVGTNAAPLAVVVIELELLAGTKLDDRIVRAYPVAVIALKAITAAHAATRFKKGVFFGQTVLHFIKRGRAARKVKHRTNRLRRISVVPSMQTIEACQRRLGY